MPSRASRSFLSVAICALVLNALISMPSQAAEKQLLLEKGDRVIFLGDSITQAGARPGGYVTLVREALGKTEAPAEIEVIGAGISGNRVPDLEKRLERDVLSKKPDWVFIYIGINDVWHSLNNRGTSKKDFEEGLKRIIAQIREQGGRVILCTPSVIGEKTDASNQLDEMLEEYCEISRKVAKELKTHTLDLRQEFLEHLKSHNADNAEKGILTSDGVHLNEAGNRFVADKMLAALGLEVPTSQVLRHVVLFQFKEGTPENKVTEIVREFAALPKKIDAIIDFEHGTDVSVENLADGFTHCFVVTFQNEAGRDEYLPHAAHQGFVSLLKPHLEKVLVIDYKANRD